MRHVKLSGVKVPGISICSPCADSRILKSDHSGRSFSGRLTFQRPSGVRRVSVLSDLRVGETGILVSLDLPESVQNHLMHMGLVPDARVTVLRRAPAGDPTVYAVDGIEIALRRETASAIMVRAAQTETTVRAGAQVEVKHKSDAVGTAGVELAGAITQ